MVMRKITFDRSRSGYLIVFLLIFALVFVRYCYYGFEYYYQLDDYIQYHNYTDSDGSVFDVIKALGMLAARPLANCADVIVWANFFDFMIVGLALISVMFAASACLFWWVWRRNLGTGYIFLVIYTLLPLGFEGTYWMSAATRVVVGLFFASLALYFFERWCTGGKKRMLAAYIICHILCCGFYEQTIAFSVTAVILLGLLHYKNEKKRSLWALVTIADMIIYFAFTSIFSDSVLYGDRSSIILPTTSYYWKVYFPEVCRQMFDAFARGGFYTLAKGFKRGIIMMVQDRAVIYAAVIVILAIMMYSAAEKKQAGEKLRAAAAVGIGLILAIAPLAPFFVVENTWFSLRGTVTSFCGIALAGDAVIGALFARSEWRRQITAGITAIIVLVCCTASVSELHDYKQTTENDTRAVKLVLETLNSDGITAAETKVGVLGLEASFLGDQNFYYHEHVHGVTESDWAFSGAMTRYQKYHAAVTPIPSDPMYRPWNCSSMRLSTFDVLYLYNYEENSLTRLDAVQIEGETYEIYSESGEYLGYTWEEDNYGYLVLGKHIEQN